MAVTTTTTAASIIEKRVSLQITETLIQNSVMMGAVRDFSGLVGPGMDRLDIPNYTELAVQDVSETVEMTPQDPTIAVDQLDLDLHKSIPFALSDKASLQAKLNIVADIVNNAGKSLAADVDNQLIAEIAAGVSTAAPDHRLALTANPDDDIRTARRLLNVANVPMQDRFLLISPVFEEAMLGVAGFVETDKYGSSEPIMNGEIGRVFGFRVLMTTSAQAELGTDGGFMAFHRSSIGFARQMAMKFERERNVLAQRDEYALTHLYGVQGLGDGTRQVVFNATGA